MANTSFLSYPSAKIGVSPHRLLFLWAFNYTDQNFTNYKFLYIVDSVHVELFMKYFTEKEKLKISVNFISRTFYDGLH